MAKSGDAATSSATERLGAFIASVSANEIGVPRLLHEAKRSLLNFFGCALSASDDEAVKTAVTVSAPFSGAPAATLIGRSERLDIAAASFVNAIGANLYDFDDTHLNTVIHPTAPVAPVVLALAEQRGFSGREVLEAFVIGAEVECRIGNSVSPKHYARGWHITASCGVFGAAAAAARLLKLDAAQCAHALGIAASQSGSLVENLATSGKNVGVGNAARNGLLSAFFAEQGYKAAPLAIEGPLGWARAMGDVPQLDEIYDGLGERWEFLENTYKPYCGGIVFHSEIDACLELRNKGVRAADIASIDVYGNALFLARGDRAVTNERDARVSIAHSAAVALLYGAAGLHEFSPEVVMLPEVKALRARVAAVLDDRMPTGASRVSVTTTDGRTLEATVVHARGSIEKPLTDADIEAKARALAAGKSCDIEKLIAANWSLDKAPGVAELMRAASRK